MFKNLRKLKLVYVKLRLKFEDLLEKKLYLVCYLYIFFMYCWWFFLIIMGYFCY